MLMLPEHNQHIGQEWVKIMRSYHSAISSCTKLIHPLTVDRVISFFSKKDMLMSYCFKCRWSNLSAKCSFHQHLSWK